MILYRIPKENRLEEEYANIESLAFEIDDHLFFTDKATAVRLCDSKKVVEIHPV